MEKNGELPDYDELASEEKPSGGPQKDNLKDAEALLDDNDSSMETEEGGSGKPIKKNQSGKSTNSPDNEIEMPPIYYTIRASRKSNAAITTLDGRAVQQLHTGSFDSANDGRLEKTNMRYSYDNTQNISASFNMDSLSCNTCLEMTEHVALYREVEDEDMASLTPVCFFLTDQNFPPCIPVEAYGECIKILRIEDGTLKELTNAFTEVVLGFSIPAGSTVAISSLTHLAKVGPVAYTEDYCNAVKQIRDCYANGMRIIHGIPLNIGCTLDAPTIRAWIDVDRWLTRACGQDQVSETRKLLRGYLTAKEGTDRQQTYNYSARWPAGPKNSTKITLVSEGVEDLLNSFPPMSEAIEADLLQSLLKELNEKFATGLSLHVSTVRIPSGSSVVDKEQHYPTTLILIGASHASRLVDALEDQQVKLVDLTQPGWKLNPDNIQDKIEELRGILDSTTTGEITVVFQLFDSCCFLGRTSSGVSVANRLHGDNVYHLEGSLELIGRQDLKDLLFMALPLFRTAKHHRKIIITPMQRYIAAPCCSNSQHVTNHNDPNFARNMVNGLAAIRETTKDFVYMKRITNFRVSSADKLLGWDANDPTAGDRLAALWGMDPIHMTRAGYRALATKIVDMANSEEPFTNSRRMPGRDESKQRNSWVAADSASARRKRSEERREGGHGDRAKYGRQGGYHPYSGRDTGNRGRGGRHGKGF